MTRGVWEAWKDLGRDSRAFYRNYNPNHPEAQNRWELEDNLNQSSERFTTLRNRQRSLFKAVARGNRRRRWSYTGVGEPLTGLGIGAAAYKTWDFLNPQNQEQRWSNSWDFRGSQNYSSMVGLRREAMKPQSKQMGFFQSIDVGASQARGNKSGPTNVRNIGNFLGGAVQGAGSFIGAATEGPLAAAGYMMGGGNTPMAQAYTEGMEVLVGGAINSMVDGLKSIFN
jgi:hypothetical protein